MLDSDVIRRLIDALKEDGAHYERDLFALFHPYQIGTVVATLQVLTLAGDIRPAGDGPRKRYTWIGRI